MADGKLGASVRSQQGSALHHSIALDSCTCFTAQGVLSIVAYDAGSATLETPCGTLTVGGRELCVSELSVQTGEVKIGGQIEYVQYTVPRTKRGLLAHLGR